MYAIIGYCLVDIEVLFSKAIVVGQIINLFEV